jgi:hypothetical protein
MDMTIMLSAKLSENLTQYRGSPIVDTDEGLVWLRVDSNDVYTEYTYHEDDEPYEFWGERGTSKVGSLDIRVCTFWGRPILNSEEIVRDIVSMESW